MALKHLMPALMHFYIGPYNNLRCNSRWLISTDEQKWSRRAPVRNSMTNSVSARLHRFCIILYCYLTWHLQMLGSSSVQYSRNGQSDFPPSDVTSHIF